MAEIETSVLRIGSNDLVLQDGAARGSLANAYSASSTYAVGDYVLYGGQLYECNTAISTAEAWTAAHWTAVTVGGELATVKDGLNTLKTGVITSGVKTNGTRLFDLSNVVVGETLFYSLTASTGSAGYIGLYDSTNTRITYYGKGSSSWSDNDYSGTFIVPNNFAYATVGGGTITVNVSREESIEDIYNKIDDIDEQLDAIKESVPTVFTGTGENGAYIPSTLSVGDTITFTTNSYRRIYKTSISEGDVVWLANCAGFDNSAAWQWAVCDENNKIVGLPSVALPRDRMLAKVIAPTGAKTLYWNVAVRKTLVIPENNKFVLFKGNKTEPEITVSSATLKSGTSIVDNAKSKVAVISNGGYIQYPLTSDIYLNAGVWVKCDYANASKITSLNVTLMNGTTARTTLEIPKERLCTGQWIFAKIGYPDNTIDGIRVSATFASGNSSVIVNVSPFAVTDQFSRPIAVINFDHAWQASEDCGAYDLLINNNIPFTITGGLYNVDETTKAKLLDAYASGLLDVGCYGNETYDGTAYPITSTTDMATADSNMLNLLSQKHNIGVDPTSFGPANHIINLNIVKTLKDYGFDITRVYGNVGGTNAMFIEKDMLCITETHTSLTAANVASNLLVGLLGMFAHGVSSNPSAETEPSLYTPYSSFSGTVSALLDLVANQSVEIMNMKQFAEYVRENYSVGL